jgi:transposase InsO family protein
MYRGWICATLSSASRWSGPATVGPRITAALWRQGRTVNPKRVYRLTREDNLLCLRRRQFVITTDSEHALPVYSNRARELVLTRIDELWWPILPTSVWSGSSFILR